MVAIDFHRLLRHHVGGHRWVPQGLGLHDSLHIGAPSVLSSHQDARAVLQSLSQLHFLDLVAEDLLDEFAKSFVAGFLLFKLLLLLLAGVQFETFLGAVLQLLSVELLQLLNDVLVDGVDHVNHLKSPLLEGLNKRRDLHCWLALPGDEEDVLLSLLHSSDVIFERDLVISALAGEEPQILSEFGSVRGVLVDSELQVLRELLVELLVVLSILNHLLDHLEALLRDVLLDDL